jgi:hypothetical protein
MLGQCLLRLFGLCLAAQGDGYPPVIAVCHGTTLTHPKPGRRMDGRRVVPDNGLSRRAPGRENVKQVNLLPRAAGHGQR